MSSVRRAVSATALLQHLGSLVPEFAEKCSAHRLGTMADRLAWLIGIRCLDAIFLAIIIEPLRSERVWLFFAELRWCRLDTRFARRLVAFPVLRHIVNSRFVKADYAVCSPSSDIPYCSTMVW